MGLVNKGRKELAVRFRCPLCGHEWRPRRHPYQGLKPISCPRCRRYFSDYRCSPLVVEGGE